MIPGEIITLERELRSAGAELARALQGLNRRPGALRQQTELLRWVAALRITRGLSQLTCARYFTAAAEFLQWVSERGKGLREVSRDDVEAWVFQLFVAHQAAGTRGLKTVGLRSFLRWRQQQGLGDDPSATVPVPKRERRVPRRFSSRQLLRLLATCDLNRTGGRRDYALLLFLLGTGARRSEVAGLGLEQLELSDRGGGVRFFGKGAKERVVAFDGTVAAALRQWLCDRDRLAPAHASVFVGLSGRNTGGPLGASGMDRVLRTRLKRARISIGSGVALHAFRATFATALLDEGFDLREIQTALGHEDIKTTTRYLAGSQRQARVRVRVADLIGHRAGRPLPGYAKSKLGLLAQGSEGAVGGSG